MEIVVDGWRSSVAGWDAVRNIPPDRLAELSPEQREVAKKLGVKPEDYARSVMAGERPTFGPKAEANWDSGPS